MAQLTNAQLVATWNQAVEALRGSGANGDTVRRFYLADAEMVRRGLLPALDASPMGREEV